VPAGRWWLVGEGAAVREAGGENIKRCVYNKFKGAFFLFCTFSCALRRGSDLNMKIYALGG